MLAIGIAIALVSFALLSMFRSYFLDSLEDSLLVQADLIAQSILPEVDSVSIEPVLPAAFNALQQQSEQLSVQIQNQAADAKPGSATEALAALRQANIAVTSSLQTDVYIFDHEYELLLSPVESTSQPAAFTSLAEAALLGKTSHETITYAENRHLVVATPLRVGDDIIAAFVLSHPLHDLEAVFQNLWIRLTISALLSLILTSILSLIFTRNLQEPLQQLRAASEHLREGDYAYPLPQGRKDELGDLSRTFDAMRTQIQSTEKLRTRFLSDVAHELRTPLTSIKGLTETLQDGAVEDVDVRDRFLSSIERETDRLIRLTQDLLTLTRADVEGFKLHKETLKLSSQVEQLLMQFEVEASRKSVQFEFIDHSDSAWVSVDRDRINQVLVNLLDNALQYTPEGSTITLEIDVGKSTDLPPECTGSAQVKDAIQQRAGDWLMLSITDQGPGIPEADLERVFDRFYRIEMARDRQRGGSGLGLAIARAIIEAHAGCIWIQSPVEAQAGAHSAGTTVFIGLPTNPEVKS
jgi:signal transduction histidine kinase